MNTFSLDKNYSQINFEEISVDDLEIISGGGCGGESDHLPIGAFTSWGGALGGMGGIIATNSISGFSRGGLAGAFIGTSFGVGYAVGTAAYSAFANAYYG